MKKKSSVILILFIIFTAGLFIQRLFFARPEAAPAVKKRGIEKTAVKVERVKRQDLDFTLSYVGGLKAKDEALVFSRAGGKLKEYLFNEGDRVDKGQVIALVDRDETGLTYELAKADAPISGIVGRTFLDRGQAVIAQSTALAMIVDMDNMVMVLNIPEPDISYIKKGLEAHLKTDAYADEDFKGEITKVSQVLDPQTRSLPIEITVPNPGHRLKSGMFAKINILAGKRANALVIAQDALVKEDSLNYVYTAEDSIAKKIRVKPGIRQDSKIEILEGLEENQKVIVFGHQGLKDGAQVSVIE
ncbi:efflux RND transporter periplasmic adaptor subunit [bacterium]|nr:MAG: efflux RND transporter periplasmic adaptor subunit [bacterium]